jgi:hypothetical protein
MVDTDGRWELRAASSLYAGYKAGRYVHVYTIHCMPIAYCILPNATNHSADRPHITYHQRRQPGSIYTATAVQAASDSPSDALTVEEASFNEPPSPPPSGGSSSGSQNGSSNCSIQYRVWELESNFDVVFPSSTPVKHQRRSVRSSRGAGMSSRAEGAWRTIWSCGCIIWGCGCMHVMDIEWGWGCVGLFVDVGRAESPSGGFLTNLINWALPRDPDCSHTAP